MKKSLGLIAVSVLSVVLVFCTVAAYAEEQYQTEVSTNYLRSDLDSNGRSSMYGVSAVVFFDPVKTAEHSYAEAAFLERIGSVNAGVWNYDWKSGQTEGKGPMLIVGVNYAQPGFPLAIQAMYYTEKIKYNGLSNGKIKVNGYSLSIGNYFTDTLLVGVAYGYSKADYSFTGFSSPSTNSKDYGLFAKYVYELEHDRELSFEGNMGTSKSDDGTETLSNTNVALAIDYYFNRSLSAGVGIDNRSGKDKANEGRTYSTNVRYFFTPRISVQATYDRFRNDNPSLFNDKTVGAILAARF